MTLKVLQNSTLPLKCWELNLNDKDRKSHWTALSVLKPHYWRNLKNHCWSCHTIPHSPPLVSILQKKWVHSWFFSRPFVDAGVYPCFHMHPSLIIIDSQIRMIIATHAVFVKLSHRRLCTCTLTIIFVLVLYNYIQSTCLLRTCAVSRRKEEWYDPHRWREGWNWGCQHLCNQILH